MSENKEICMICLEEGADSDHEIARSLESAPNSPPPPPPLSSPPPVWEHYKDPVTQNKYYYNRITRVTTWVPPPPPAWEQHYDTETGEMYYYNHITRVTTWSPPPLHVPYTRASVKQC